MKRKSIILVILLVLGSVVMIQSCSKDNGTITTYKAPVPATPSPSVGKVVTLSGTSYTLTWVGTAPTWDIYIGTTSSPSLAKSGVTGNSYTFTTAVGGEFWWYVKTVDSNNVTTIE